MQPRDLQSPARSRDLEITGIYCFSAWNVHCQFAEPIMRTLVALIHDDPGGQPPILLAPGGVGHQVVAATRRGYRRRSPVPGGRRRTSGHPPWPRPRARPGAARSSRTDQLRPGGPGPAQGARRGCHSSATGRSRGGSRCHAAPVRSRGAAVAGWLAVAAAAGEQTKQLVADLVPLRALAWWRSSGRSRAGEAVCQRPICGPGWWPGAGSGSTSPAGLAESTGVVVSGRPPGAGPARGGRSTGGRPESGGFATAERVSGPANVSPGGHVVTRSGRGPSDMGRIFEPDQVLVCTCGAHGPGSPDRGHPPARDQAA